MLPIAVIVVLSLLVLALAVLATYAIAQRNSLRRTNDELTRELADSEAQVEALKGALNEQSAQIVAWRTKFEGIDDRFKALAGEVLEKSSQQLQREAIQQLDQRKAAIETLLKPVHEALKSHAEQVGRIEKDREGAYQGLKQQLAGLLLAQQQLGQQTTTLATALRGSATARGRWGELTLKRIAELAGMVAHCDFGEQVTIWKGEQAQRPDMVVRLPGERAIVIDAKSVGQNYHAALDAGDEPTRRRCLEGHVRDIENRVRELSNKAYTQQLGAALDYVVLFIPGESFLHPAVELKPDLIESALSRKVIIATPTLLIALLRVIELGWREQKLAENAKRVQSLGVELHERVATVVGHIGTLGSSLERAVKSYNSFVGSFESRVVSTARKFKELGADSQKELPAEGEVKQIDVLVRELRGTGEGHADADNAAATSAAPGAE